MRIYSAMTAIIALAAASTMCNATSIVSWRAIEQQLEAAVVGSETPIKSIMETEEARRLWKDENAEMYLAMMAQTDQTLVPLLGFSLMRKKYGDRAIEPLLWFLSQDHSTPSLLLDDAVIFLRDPQRSEAVGHALAALAAAPPAARPRYNILVAGGASTSAVSIAYQKLKSASAQPDAVAVIIARLYDDDAIGDESESAQRILRKGASIPSTPRAMYLSYTYDRDTTFYEALGAFLRDEQPDSFLFPVIVNLHRELIKPKLDAFQLSKEQRQRLENLLKASGDGLKGTSQPRSADF